MSNQKCKDAPGLVLRLRSVNEAATFLVKEKICIKLRAFSFFFFLLFFFRLGRLVPLAVGRVVIIFLLNLHN